MRNQGKKALGKVNRTGIHIFSGAFLVGKPLFNLFRDATRIVADFVYPPVCLLCGGGFDRGRWLCTGCLGRIRDSRRIVIHARPEDFPYLSGERHFDGVSTVWEFNKDLEQLIHLAKYSGMKNLARFLGVTAGDVLAHDTAFTRSPFQIMIPIPLHKVRQRERGYNQSRCVCDGLSESLGIPILPNGLYRKRYTETQTGKSGEERQVNMRDAFGTRQPERIRRKSVLLVDDVMTTGSTMNSCAKTLKEAGAERVHGITLARPLMGAFRGQVV
jgi:ComF family protein